MKSNLLFTALLASLFAFSSCDKKESNPAPADKNPATDTTNTNPVSSTVFKAKIDNTDWQAKSHNTMLSGGMSGLYGTSEDKVTLSINTAEFNRTGTYTSGSIAIETENGNRWTAYLSDSLQNEFKITDYNQESKKISGTFHFKTSFFMGAPADSAAKTVTEGVFTDIKLP